MWIPVNREVPKVGEKVIVILGEDAPEATGACTAVWFGFDDRNLPHWGINDSGTRGTRLGNVVTHWYRCPDKHEIATLAAKLTRQLELAGQ